MFVLEQCGVCKDEEALGYSRNAGKLEAPARTTFLRLRKGALKGLDTPSLLDIHPFIFFNKLVSRGELN
jgi:hypothetical protein